MHLILDRQTGSGKTYSMGTGIDTNNQQGNYMVLAAERKQPF
jgi:hypothetical protein